MIVLEIEELEHPTVRVSVVKEGVFSPRNHLQVGLGMFYIFLVVLIRLKIVMRSCFFCFAYFVF